MCNSGRAEFHSQDVLMKLRIILGSNNAEKLTIESGMPKYVEDLSSEIKRKFDIEGDIRLQYMDSDFDNEFVNLNQISDIQDKSIVKIIPLSDSVNISQGSMNQSEEETYLSSSSDTIILSSDSETTRSHCANQVFISNGNLLSPGHKLKSDILESLAQEIIKFKAYPSNLEIESVAQALIKKISLKYKMANYRTKLRKLGCPELSINSLKHKPADRCHPAYDVKKPRKAEVHFCPPYPDGETQDSLEDDRLTLLSEVKKRHNDKVVLVKEKMAKTFAYRRQEVVKDKPMVTEFKIRWPGFKCLEFYTICDFIDWLCPLFLHYVKDADGTAVQRELGLLTLGIYSIKVKGGDATTPPADVGIVVEGVEVLHDLGDIASVCALLMGVIYALNLSYPKGLKAFFEVLQKLFLELNTNNLSTKVQMLKNKMYE
uniref:PB1 domain-containing protein n=1 Tax=Fundulus heteroclitus TaxID=8078 RepID=A0A3Q2T7Y7_FUNHE